MSTCKIVKVNGHWHDAKLGVWLAYTKNGLYSKVQVNNGKPFHVKSSHVWLLKKPKRYKSIPSEVIRQSRHYRFRKPIRVVATRFIPGEIYGDGLLMMQDKSYADGVFAFNDNDVQFAQADPNNANTFNDPQTHTPGGGNASVRPLQQFGDAIGIPTGPYSNLFTHSKTAGGNAKAAIIEACDRIINLFLRRPDKEILYYSVNRFDPEQALQIGLGIFQHLVGLHVRLFITICLQHIPAMVECKRLFGHGAKFYIDVCIPLIHCPSGVVDSYTITNSTDCCRDYLDFIESNGPNWERYLKSMSLQVFNSLSSRCR